MDASAARGGTAEAVRELTGGGAHLSLDALGWPVTAAASVAGPRRRGRAGTLRPDLLIASAIPLDAAPASLATTGPDPGQGVTVILPGVRARG